MTSGAAGMPGLSLTLVDRPFRVGSRRGARSSFGFERVVRMVLLATCLLLTGQGNVISSDGPQVASADI
jgi:hypothetical protein